MMNHALNFDDVDCVCVCEFKDEISNYLTLINANPSFSKTYSFFASHFEIILFCIDWKFVELLFEENYAI
jgi:hypothetical protein